LDVAILCYSENKQNDIDQMNATWTGYYYGYENMSPCYRLKIFASSVFNVVQLKCKGSYSCYLAYLFVENATNVFALADNEQYVMVDSHIFASIANNLVFTCDDSLFYGSDGMQALSTSNRLLNSCDFCLDTADCFDDFANFYGTICDKEGECLCSPNLLESAWFADTAMPGYIEIGIEQRYICPNGSVKVGLSMINNYIPGYDMIVYNGLLENMQFICDRDRMILFGNGQQIGDGMIYSLDYNTNNDEKPEPQPLDSDNDKILVPGSPDKPKEELSIFPNHCSKNKENEYNSNPNGNDGSFVDVEVDEYLHDVSKIDEAEQSENNNIKIGIGDLTGNEDDTLFAFDYEHIDYNLSYDKEPKHHCLESRYWQFTHVQIFYFIITSKVAL